MKENKKPTSPVHSRSGRIVHDDLGNAVWEWKTGSGRFARDIDTQRLLALQDSTLTLDGIAATAGYNPYDKTTIDPVRKPRRTLDDLRKLSEHIKRSRHRN